MAERIVLHVGTMKSGTTSMQALLYADRAGLAAQGIHAPGERWEDQVRAVRDVLARADGKGETWARLAAEARDWEGTVVYSMEYLGTFTPRQASAVASTFAPTPVEVVITFRDLNRTLTSMWQETIQNGRAWSWDEFLAGARATRAGHSTTARRARRVVRAVHRRLPGEVARRVQPAISWALPSAAGDNFWHQHDVVRIARVWAEVVGEENVTLVAVPGPGSSPDALTARFGEVVGFDPATVPATPRDNSSLGAASIQVLQQMNQRLEAAGIAWDAGREVRKFALAKQILRRRTTSEQRIGLTVSPWVRAESQWREQQLRTTRMRFVGDWSDLDPVDVAGVDPSATPSAELIAVAQFGFEALVAEHGLDRTWTQTSDPSVAIDALAALVRDLL